MNRYQCENNHKYYLEYEDLILQIKHQRGALPYIILTYLSSICKQCNWKPKAFFYRRDVKCKNDLSLDFFPVVFIIVGE